MRETARARDQPDTDFHQPHVTLERHNPFSAMQRNLASSAQRHAVNGSDHGDLCIAHSQHHVLQLLDIAFDRFGATLHESWHRRLQIGARRKWFIGRPDHHPPIARLGLFHCSQQALAKTLIDQMHLGLEGNNQDIIKARPIECPKPNRLVLEHRMTRNFWIGHMASHQTGGKELACHDRQLRCCHKRT